MGSDDGDEEDTEHHDESDQGQRVAPEPSPELHAERHGLCLGHRDRHRIKADRLEGLDDDGPAVGHASSLMRGSSTPYVISVTRFISTTAIVRTMTLPWMTG